MVYFLVYELFSIIWFASIKQNKKSPIYKLPSHKQMNYNIFSLKCQDKKNN